MEKKTKMDYAISAKIQKENRVWGNKVLFIRLGVIAGILILLFGILLRPVVVDGTSMEPALHNRDVGLVFRLGQIKPGDIIMFRGEDRMKLIKRVIAVEGDKVDIKDGAVYVNGDLLDEPYIYEETEAKDGQTEFPLRVKKGHVFVLGDNRDDTTDSRNSKIGLIPKKKIKGKLVYIFRRNV